MTTKVKDNQLVESYMPLSTPHIKSFTSLDPSVVLVNDGIGNITVDVAVEGSLPNFVEAPLTSSLTESNGSWGDLSLVSTSAGSDTVISSAGGEDCTFINNLTGGVESVARALPLDFSIEMDLYFTALPTGSLFTTIFSFETGNNGAGGFHMVWGWDSKLYLRVGELTYARTGSVLALNTWNTVKLTTNLGFLEFDIVGNTNEVLDVTADIPLSAHYIPRKFVVGTPPYTHPSEQSSTFSVRNISIYEF